MHAGKLDRQIIFQAKTNAQDDFGGVVESWSTYATVWAQYLPGGGNEKYVAAQIYAQTEGRFRVRWLSGLSTAHKIVFEGREYDILSIDEIERRRELEIRVRARAA